jgi:hypothetical protein
MSIYEGVNMASRQDAFSDGARGRALRAFIAAAEDLRKRSALTATHYDATQAAALVRRLLTDRAPIATEAARYFGLSLSFEWSPDTVLLRDADSTFLLSGAGFSPQLAAAHIGADRMGDPTLARGALDAFLAASVVELSGESSDHASVNDVVRFYAHELGGVHWHLERPSRGLDIVETARQRAPRQLDWTMIAIARVAYRAIEPPLNRAAGALLLIT